MGLVILPVQDEAVQGVERVEQEMRVNLLLELEIFELCLVPLVLLGVQGLSRRPEIIQKIGKDIQYSLGDEHHHGKAQHSRPFGYPPETERNAVPYKEGSEKHRKRQECGKGEDPEGKGGPLDMHPGEPDIHRIETDKDDDCRQIREEFVKHLIHYPVAEVVYPAESENGETEEEDGRDRGDEPGQPRRPFRFPALLKPVEIFSEPQCGLSHHLGGQECGDGVDCYH